jgi:ABC-type multidrug transport system ATPase subunit
MTVAMVHIEDATIGWPGRVVATGLNLRIGAGEVVGLVGRNGVGKSTLLQVLAGRLAPLAGTVRISTHAPTSAEARAIVGYVPERMAISDQLTVLEQLWFAGTLRLHKAAIAAAVDRQLQRLDLVDSAHRLCGQLSRGTRQRIGLAQALLASPQLLLLDEPSSGVDGDQQVRMMNVLREEADSGVAVVLSTHVRDDLSLLRPRLLTIASGAMLDTP